MVTTRSRQVGFTIGVCLVISLFVFGAVTLVIGLDLPTWLPLAVTVLLMTVPLLVILDEKYVMVALFGALAYPYRIPIQIGALSSFSVGDVALILSWVVILLRRGFLHTSSSRAHAVQGRKFHFETIDLLIWLYVGMNLLSFFWAQEPALAVRGLVPIVENVAFYYLIVVYGSSWHRTDQVIGWFLKLGIVALALSVFFYFGRLDFLDISSAQQQDALYLVSIHTRLGSPAWGASNYFASIFLLFLPSYLSLAMLSEKWRSRLNFRLVAAVGLLAFFFTFSRGGYIALAVGIVVGLVLIFRRHRLSARIITALIVVVILIGLGIRLAIDYFPDVQQAMAEIYTRVFVLDDAGVLARYDFAQSALGSIQENPLGLGTGNFSALTELGGFGVHDIYLQTALETGWVGLLVFVLMLGFMFRANWRLLKRLKNTRYAPLAIGLVVSFVAVLINVAGEASFEGIVFGWIFWLTQGLVRALGRSYPDQSQSQPGARYRSEDPT